MIAVFDMRYVVSIVRVLFWGELNAMLHYVKLLYLTPSNQPGCVGVVGIHLAHILNLYKRGLITALACC